MNKLKMIDGGTPSGSDPALCCSCSAGQVVKGRNNEELRYCHRMDKRITIEVLQCGEYKSKSDASLWDMQQVAWNLLTDKKGHRIGFKSPGATRSLVNDETIDHLPDLD